MSATAPRVASEPVSASIAGLLLLLFVGALACNNSEETREGGGEGNDGLAVSSSKTAPEGEAKQILVLGDWARYPVVGADEKWDDETLNGRRWAQVTAELACVGRRSRGDPEAHRQRVRNILSHHHTTLSAIAAWSTRLNHENPRQTHSWARPISDVVKSCH